MWVLRAQLWRWFCAVATLLVCGALQPAWTLSSPTARPVGEPAAGDLVYGVGEEFTVQTDASLVQLAHTAPRENVAAVKERLGAQKPSGASHVLGTAPPVVTSAYLH